MIFFILFSLYLATAAFSKDVFTKKISLEMKYESMWVSEPEFPEKSLPNYLPDLVKYPANLTHLKLCLMKDAVIYKDSKAYELLGRFTFFGYPDETEEKKIELPINCDDVEFKNEEELKKFQDLVKKDKLNSFDRNYHLAMEYLSEANSLGSANAPAYMYFMMSQYFIIENITESVKIESLPSPKMMREMLIIASNRNSFLGKQLLLQEQKNCRLLENEEFLDDFKEDLTNKSQPRPLNYLYGPLEEMNCLKCSEALMVGIEAAHTAIEHLQNFGGESPKVPLFEDIKNENLHSEKNPIEELAIYKQSAAAGNSNAQLALGELYFFGNADWGVERDLQQARDYFEIAAENHDNGNALHNMGLMYAQGIGAEKNGTKAKYYFDRAIKKGATQSNSGLAFLYLNGLGVEKNYTKAVEYFKKAAAKGDVEAMSNLGAKYLDGTGVEKANATQALYYFKKAAQKKQLSSMLNIAILYLRGIQDSNDTCEDVIKNIYEVLSRIDKTDSLAKGIIKYKKGDYVGAYFYNALASGIGITKANDNIDFLFKEKFNHESSLQCRYGDFKLCRVIFLYKLLVNGGKSVGSRLGDILLMGSSSFKKDYNLAMFSYKLASDFSPEAKYSVAYMYEEGLGVEKNVSRAIEECEKILKDVYSGKFERENMWPALLYKFKLQFKQSFIGSYFFNSDSTKS